MLLIYYIVIQILWCTYLGMKVINIGLDEFEPTHTEIALTVIIAPAITIMAAIIAIYDDELED